MWKTLALALAALSVACSTAQARPPIWIVRDADSEIVLFGSIHVLPPGLDWKPPPLARALTAADDLWFELPIDPATEAETARLAAAVREVLAEAIAAGGSTLRDYAAADGALGYFQHNFRVYDREGERCPTPNCRGTIQRQVQGGRSTFYCSVCQR